MVYTVKLMFGSGVVIHFNSLMGNQARSQAKGQLRPQKDLVSIFFL